MDKARALHWFCANYHNGQNSFLYGVMSQLRYTPSILDRGPEEGDDDWELYKELEALEKINHTHQRVAELLIEVQQELE